MPSGIPGRKPPVDLDRDWMPHAACIGCDPELFFPSGRRWNIAAEIAEAKAICRRCEVQPECLAYALKNCIRHGVWGGTSEGERIDLRRRMRLGDG